MGRSVIATLLPRLAVQIKVETLHAVSAPAVRAAVKTELFYRNDAIRAFFFIANRSNDNAKVALPFSNT